MSNVVSSETPRELARVSELMSSYPADWCLCGGWAVDAWLGRITREHGDLDINIFEDGEPALYKHLGDWQMVPHDGALAGRDTNELWTGRKLAMPAHFHCRAPEDAGDFPKRGALLSEDGWYLDINVNPRTDAGWTLYDDPHVAMPLNRAVAESRWGIPTAVPEVLLLYKATAYKGTRNYLRRRDHEDFERLLLVLNSKQRAWLIESISRVDVDHPWLGVLAS